MNISTTKKELQSAFNKLSKTTQLKSQNPLINYTYISSSASGVVLHSTDLEVGIKTQITASINSPGEGLFPTSEMNDIINVIEDGRVDIDISGPHINIKSEKGISFDIATIPLQDYPAIPENKHELIFPIKSDELKELIDQVIYIIKVDPTKPALSGACFSFKEKQIDVVSTDGHRLIKISNQNKTNINGSFIIPKKFLIILNAFLQDTDEVNVIFSGDHVFCNNAKDVFYSKIIDEKFPNYDAVIPSENPNKLILDKTDMSAALKAASIAVNKNTNQISLNFGEGKVFIKSINQSDNKTVHAPLKSAKYNGDECIIGFNLQYLKDAVSKYPEEKLIINFKNESSAVLLQPESKNINITSLIMPVRINE